MLPVKGKGKAKPVSRRPGFFGLVIIFLIAVGLVLRASRFVPPGVRLSVIAAMTAVFALIVFIYIIKKP